MGRQFILANFPSGSAIKPESIIVFWQLVLQVPYLECVGYSAGESSGSSTNPSLDNIRKSMHDAAIEILEARQIQTGPTVFR